MIVILVQDSEEPRKVKSVIDKNLGNPLFGSSEFPSSLFDVRRALTMQKDLPLSGFNVRTKQVIYRLDLPNMLSLTCVSRALTSSRIHPESGINIH